MIMGCGLLVWSIVCLAGSFMTTFESLLALRCLGGIGGIKALNFEQLRLMPNLNLLILFQRPLTHQLVRP